MDYQEHKLFLTKNASTYRVRAILNHKILNGSWYSPYYDRTPHSAKKTATQTDGAILRHGQGRCFSTSSVAELYNLYCSKPKQTVVSPRFSRGKHQKASTNTPKKKMSEKP